VLGAVTLTVAGVDMVECSQNYVLYLKEKCAVVKDQDPKKENATDTVRILLRSDSTVD
jgi:hypothetical protein